MSLEAKVVSLDLHRLGDARFLSSAITFTALSYRDGKIAVSFHTDRQNREWLRTHPDKLRAALGEIKAISTADGSRTWRVADDGPFLLDFPAEHPERFRVCLLVEDLSADGSPVQLWKESILLHLEKRKR